MSNPLFQKTLKKASANVAKELRKLYESLEIEESEEESSDDYFGYIEGLNAYNEYEESSDDLSLRYIPGGDGFNRKLQLAHQQIIFSKDNVPAELQCDICTFNRQKALGFIESGKIYLILNN